MFVPLLQALDPITANSLPAAKKLLAAGANPNWRDRIGALCLSFALLFVSLFVFALRVAHFQSVQAGRSSR